MKRSSALPFSAAFTFATMQAVAQASGVANPPEAIVADQPAPTYTAAPATASSAPGTSPSTRTSAPTSEPPFTIVGPSAAVAPDPHHVSLSQLNAQQAGDDDASLMVLDVPAAENELPAGTILRVRVHQELDTTKTTTGTALLGELSDPVERNGRVLLPAGTPFEAIVTAVHGGKRISGAALIHIEPRHITLNGVQYPIRASVIDTDQYGKTRIDNEGNIVRRDHVGATLAAMSLTTGGAAAAGGVFGGVPGALIGAGIGAGASTIWWLKQDRQMHLAPEATIVFSLSAPIFLNHPRSEGAE
ncbi:hypothetical protein [Terriglobus saanensis]|uniref:TrbI/VirB10 family protein n=1 Tax=Terriglobus saanensis (strain ATCC BAA-1853 / DSM 23119 / SP1PR4) TaxID=401053 RepID=E8V1P0_TERSS|nr:hypothetical protein [Terriglobus saanensis]ADV82321.1 hypothetical protein AciPR4_1498 [Terriglobus saanensis SP1PR4]